MSNFYGTKIEIWDGFGLVGIAEKKIGANYEQLLRSFFPCFQGQKENFKFQKKYCSVRTKKMHKMQVKKILKMLKI